MGSSRHARLVIKNLDEGTAHNIRLEVEPREGQKCPLVQGDYDEKVHVEVLRCRGCAELL